MKKKTTQQAKEIYLLKFVRSTPLNPNQNHKLKQKEKYWKELCSL